MAKVALTGGIATGKSYVLGRLRERGIATADADEIVHEILGPGTSSTSAVAATFGSEYLAPDGRVDRSLLAAKVFREPRARLTLEAIVHPVVYEQLEQWFASLHGAPGVASIPLLFETHRERDFDYIIVTACTPEQQMDRLAERGMDREQARQRIAAQLPGDEKVARANFVVRTDGTLDETEQQVETLAAEIAKL
jgi:dephospho-CoA kinase